MEHTPDIVDIDARHTGALEHLACVSGDKMPLLAGFTLQVCDRRAGNAELAACRTAIALPMTLRAR